MTLSEFKAWFEGYTEGLEAAPTKAQFDRIKEKVKLIDGAPITQTVYVDRYVRPYYYTWGLPYNGFPQPNYYGIGATGGSAKVVGTLGDAQGQAYSNAYSASNLGKAFDQNFDSHTAMYALGKAEAMN